jgi:hypothetical protein
MRILVIERFVVTLRALAALPVSPPREANIELLVGDCADALRLELDCPQQDFTAAQRVALRQLNDVLETGTVQPAVVARTAREVCDALGISLLAGEGLLSADDASSQN